MHYGVEIARRAWIEASDVLNARPHAALLSLLEERPQKGA
jgi:histidinol phosphatase-like PHP family hydrolase